MAATLRPCGFVLPLLFFASCVAQAQAGDKVVTASNYQFTPADARILVGETVTWTNVGGMHNVYSNDGLFHNQISTDPWQLSFTFKTPGTYSYLCQQHGGGGYGGFNMRGSVTVRSSNAPPQLSIASPGQGQQFAGNDPVTLSANAQDDGVIDQVEFFDGAISLGVVRANPFALNVALSPGAHSVRAKATDDDGLVAESQAVNFSNRRKS
jgi:plastocyanin